MYVNFNKNHYKYSSAGVIILLVASLAVTGFVFFYPTIEENITPAGTKDGQKISQGVLNRIFEAKGETVQILIYTETHDYAEIVSRINELGGIVTQQYQYAKGIAAELPKSVVFEISQMEDVLKVEHDDEVTPSELSKDEIAALDLELPESAFEIDTSEIASLELTKEDIMTMAGEMSPENYANALTMGALPLWAAGNFGQGSLAVVIDTGIYADHSMFLPGQVIGGIDLSSDVGTEFEGPFQATNHWHGTHVAGSLAGNGAYLFPTDSLLVQSMLFHGFDVPTYEEDPSLSIVTLFGMAPAADLYAIKIFNHFGSGVPRSVVIAGIEHAISLHQSGTDVDIVNMSLGGGDGYEGRDLESQVVDFGTSLGITFVVSAGNDGPSGLTIGVPSGANTAITVGAALTPAHTRVFWDFAFGFLGIGNFLFSPDESQMVYFSSRGPTSDGRDKPTASTVGLFVLSAFTGNPGSLGFASGTSMSSPAMAGIIALLNSDGESMGASPYDYKQAVIAGSIPLPGFDEFEQGAGFASAIDSWKALMEDTNLGEAHPSLDTGFSVQASEPFGMQIDRVDGSTTFSFEELTPGHVQHYWFPVHPTLEKITIEVSDVELGSNPLGINSFEVHLMSAMRSTISGYHLYSVNVYGDATLEVSDLSSTASGSVFGVNTRNYALMDGYYRLSIENDFTSFDSLSGTFTVTLKTDDRRDQGDEIYNGYLENYHYTGWFEVGFGTSGVELKLSWKNDWAWYPASDMDMIVLWYDTDGDRHVEFGGATFSSPEMVKIDTNDIAVVYVVIIAFETYGNIEPWNLKVTYL